ncbi:MAG TPA: cation transporter [Nitratifractor sp.]|nr:cation transporter [Nitratifractor sp.]HHH21166.1 cation transporter [Nitratifractor sp.]
MDFFSKVNSFSRERKATVVATATATLLAFVKLVIGLMSGSVAVLASAIDSILDTAISIFNFFAIKKAEEQPNEKFSYGKGKIQAIAGVIEGTIITISGLYIIYEALSKLINKETTTMLGVSVWVMVISIMITFFLVKYLEKIAKETDNLVIKSDALHYKTDLYSNGAVLLALFLVSLTGLDLIDAIFGLAIGVYIIYSAYEIIVEGVLILLDRSLDADIVAKIGEIISSSAKVRGYHWLKTRTDGSHNFVDFHLVLDPKMTLEEAHEIGDKLICEISSLDATKGWVINPHFDPHDDEELNIRFYNGTESCGR